MSGSTTWAVCSGKVERKSLTKVGVKVTHGGHSSKMSQMSGNFANLERPGKWFISFKVPPVLYPSQTPEKAGRSHVKSFNTLEFHFISKILWPPCYTSLPWHQLQCSHLAMESGQYTFANNKGLKCWIELISLDHLILGSLLPGKILSSPNLKRVLELMEHVHHRIEITPTCQSKVLLIPYIK